MKKHYDLKKLRMREKPSQVSRTAKVPTSVRIDLDVIGWLQSESERTGIPYQTLLNAKLREAMDARRDTALDANAVRAIVREELAKKSA